jgi:putative transposase
MGTKMMNEHDLPVVFHALDYDADIEITEGRLPHWFQTGATIFITFRLADSLPAAVIQRWQNELHDWLSRQDLTEQQIRILLDSKSINDSAVWKRLRPEQHAEFKRLRQRLFEHSLDECHGSCVFRDPLAAQLVAKALLHFDSVRYHLDSFVIMPNHVHALTQFLPGYNLSTVGQSWMRYSARKVNKALHRTGPLWQPEPFDHVVRSPEQFHYLQRYIQNNAAKPNLKNGEYVYWSRNVA